MKRCTARWQPGTSEIDEMEQDRIWKYLQNEGVALGHFDEARYRNLMRWLPSAGRVLNVGVGSGGLERLAVARGIEIYALDPSEHAIRKLASELGLGDRARKGRAEAMPFADGVFDVVVMSEVLEHLEDEQARRALREAFRVLRPGGFLMVTTPYRENLALNMVVCPCCGHVFHRVGHVRSFDRASLVSLVTGAGFRVRRAWVTAFVDWGGGPLRRMRSAVRWVLARVFGERITDPHLIVTAQRPRS